jgi:hypothetical protein
MAETWVHYNKLESKAHSMAWICPTSPVAKEFKSESSSGYIMLTILGYGSTVLVHFNPKSISHLQ